MMGGDVREPTNDSGGRRLGPRCLRVPLGRLDPPTPLTGCCEGSSCDRYLTEPGETGDFATRESVVRHGGERWGLVRVG